MTDNKGITPEGADQWVAVVGKGDKWDWAQIGNSPAVPPG